jgi:hypothetical protein
LEVSALILPLPKMSAKISENVTIEQFEGFKEEVKAKLQVMEDRQTGIMKKLNGIEEKVDHIREAIQESEHRTIRMMEAMRENFMAALEKFYTKVEQPATAKRKFSEKLVVFSTEAEVVPVAKNKVSVSFSPETPYYVNTNVFASPAPPTHRSEPDTFDRYLKHQGIPSFTPSIVRALIPSGQTTTSTASSKKLQLSEDFSAAECSSTFPDSVSIPEDAPTPKDDCCTECYSYDCSGDCYTERHDSSDAEGEDEDIDPRSCEEIWASCYAVGDDFECMSEDEDCRAYDMDNQEGYLW